MKIEAKFARAVFAFVLAAVLTAGGVEEPAVESSNYWEVSGPADKITWVEIHGFEEVNGTRIAHVEVMSRKKHSKPWDFKVILPHLALSVEALKKSVTHPLKTLSVYPETYFAGYDQWKKAFDGGNAVICTTSIADALAASQ